jgi:histidinol-phosphate aminotransferase
MSYFRPAIDAIAGYTPGEQPADGRRVVKLNTNENPFPPSPRAIEAIREATGDRLRLYPSPTADAFRREAARLNGVGLDQTIAGNGSDDILTIATRAFVPEGGAVGMPVPTYSLYDTLAALQGARVEAYDFTDDYALPETLFGNELPLVFLANPNAPSGTMVDLETVERLARSMRGVLLLDEAYVDFAGARNSATLLSNCPNLVISRTLSKSYSLAGLRAGYALASPEIVRGMMKVKDSYNVNRLTDAGAAAALADRAYLKETVDRIVILRGHLSRQLTGLGFKVWPSRTNFVLARVPEGFAPPAGESPEALPAEWLYQQLKARGILVRYFKQPRLDDCLRITVGRREELDALVEELRSIIGFK